LNFMGWHISPSIAVEVAFRAVSYVLQAPQPCSG
jgi:hypothetical protein